MLPEGTGSVTVYLFTSYSTDCMNHCSGRMADPLPATASCVGILSFSLTARNSVLGFYQKRVVLEKMTACVRRL